MRRHSRPDIFLVIISLAALLLSLVSCVSVTPNAKASELTTQFRTKLIASVSVSVTARVRADYGERIYDFTFTFSGSPEDGTLTITEPAELAGLSAHVTKDGTTLSWDGAALDTGSLGEGFSPATLLPKLFSEWRSGYITAYSLTESEDGSRLKFTTEYSETVRITTVLNAETLTPLSCEVIINNHAALFAEFTDYSLT